MIPKTLQFVSFNPSNGSFNGFLSIGVAFEVEDDPQILIKKAVGVYEKYIRKMRLMVEDLNEARLKHIPVPASKIWVFGNNIFMLKNELEYLGLQVDGLYEHLSRDLSVKRKWLEKVVILRRYIPSKNIIPRASKWGAFEKGTAKKARALKKQSS